MEQQKLNRDKPLTKTIGINLDACERYWNYRKKKLIGLNIYTIEKNLIVKVKID